MTEKAGAIRVYIDPNLMNLLPTYLKRRNDDVVLLRTSIRLQDFDSIQRIAHKLYGNGSMFGFDAISKMGKSLETAAMEKDILKIQEHTQALFEYLANIEICPGENNGNT